MVDGSCCRSVAGLLELFIFSAANPLQPVLAAVWQELSSRQLM